MHGNHKHAETCSLYHPARMPMALPVCSQESLLTLSPAVPRIRLPARSPTRWPVESRMLSPPALPFRRPGKPHPPAGRAPVGCGTLTRSIRNVVPNWLTNRDFPTQAHGGDPGRIGREGCEV